MKNNSKKEIIQNNKLIPNISCNKNKLLKAFGKYLSDNYLMGDGFACSIPYKIFQHKINNGKITIADYSPAFLKMFYNKSDLSTSAGKINNAIENLKKNNYKLYQSLLIVWDKDYAEQNCHLATVYRRYNKAILIMATELGLLDNNTRQ